MSNGFVFIFLAGLVGQYGLAGFVVGFLCLLLWRMVTKFDAVIASNTKAILSLQGAISNLCLKLNV